MNDKMRLNLSLKEANAVLQAINGPSATDLTLADVYDRLNASVMLRRKKCRHMWTRIDSPGVQSVCIQCGEER